MLCPGSLCAWLWFGDGGRLVFVCNLILVGVLGSCCWVVVSPDVACAAHTELSVCLL